MRFRSPRFTSTTSPGDTRPRHVCACPLGSIACTSRWTDNAARSGRCESPPDTRPMRPCGSATTSTPAGSSSHEPQPRHWASRSHRSSERRLRRLAGAHARLAWRQVHEVHDGGRRENDSGSPETVLAKARAAYQAAHFREAVTAFGQALVELEGLSPTPVRLKPLVDARCHLVLAYFALGRPERAGEEVRRLAA